MDPRSDEEEKKKAEAAEKKKAEAEAAAEKRKAVINKLETELLEPPIYHYLNDNFIMIKGKRVKKEITAKQVNKVLSLENDDAGFRDTGKEITRDDVVKFFTFQGLKSQAPRLEATKPYNPIKNCIKAASKNLESYGGEAKNMVLDMLMGIKGLTYIAGAFRGELGNKDIKSRKERYKKLKVLFNRLTEEILVFIKKNYLDKENNLLETLTPTDKETVEKAINKIHLYVGKDVTSSLNAYTEDSVYKLFAQITKTEEKPTRTHIRRSSISEIPDTRDTLRRQQSSPAAPTMSRSASQKNMAQSIKKSLSADTKAPMSISEISTKESKEPQSEKSVPKANRPSLQFHVSQKDLSSFKLHKPATKEALDEQQSKAKSSAKGKEEIEGPKREGPKK